MSAPFIILTALGFGILLMAIIHRLGKRMNNYGIVDIAWSWGFIPLALIYIMATGNPGLRQFLLLIAVTLWSGRLGWHLYRRVMSHHPEEDGRYNQLRDEWGAQTHRKMFWFFQLQASVLVGLSLPFLVISLNHSPQLMMIEWIGFALIIGSLIGEAISDWQLDQFKKRSDSKGKTCQEGLWRYSRHPNYFFEWMVWVGFFVFSLASPNGIYTIACPILIFYFLTQKTGIPATEEQALKSRGEDYRRYQQTTSAFVPWFKKKTS